MLNNRRNYGKKYNTWKVKIVRVPSDELNLAGCIRMVGAVVKAAIQDAAAAPRNGTKVIHQYDARKFLFDDGILEAFFQRYHLAKNINCAIIRKIATDVIEGRKELTDTTDPLQTSTDLIDQEPEND